MGNLLAGPIEQLYLTAEMMMILAARPLGFALVFTAFAWAHLNSGLLRIAFGLVLALPAIHPILGEAPAMVKALPMPAFVMIGKELFIGILLGLIASLPFEALGGAGGIVDSMRGTSTPIGSPVGEVTPFGQLFMIIGLWLFASLGGFWLVVDVIFESYRLWPPLAVLPRLTLEGAAVVPGLVARFILLALTFAGPLLIVMLATDVILGIAAKVGKRVDVTFLAMSIKTLIAVLLLPVVSFGLVRAFTGEIASLRQLNAILEATLR
jgi:type III secretion protein T